MTAPNGTDLVYINEKLVDHHVNLGYKICENCKGQMSYVIPKWVPDSEDEGILLLDDWNRADPRFLSAIMELISVGEYLSWKLPENCHIIMTANPDNGDYNINSSLDNAQRTRFISFNLGFDDRAWAKWAENDGIRSELINFVLLYPELFKKDKDNVSVVNARSLVLFFNAISGIDDFSSARGMSLINLISEAAFPTEDNVVGNLFVMFLNNKLHKLITPEEILLGEWTKIKNSMLNAIYGDKLNDFRADIAATLTIRFINYIDVYLEKKGGTMEKVIDRVIELNEKISDDKPILTEDLVFRLIKSLQQAYPTKINRLLLNDTIRKKLVRK
jgi:hypothetical protein